MRHRWTRVERGLLVLAGILGMELGLAPLVEAQNSRSLLFPFITTETGKFTFITILNQGLSNPPDLVSGETPIFAYHFTYGMKPVPVVNKAGCEHLDGDVATTPADLMIFEANGKVKTDPPSNVLFEGAPPVTSSALVYPVVGRVGFLIVEQLEDPEVAPPTFEPESLAGTAAVVDSASGLALSYSTNFFNSTKAVDPSFEAMDGDCVLIGSSCSGPPDVPGNTGLKQVMWYPSSLVTTSWFVLPLGFGSAMAPPGGGGIRRSLQTFTVALPTPGLEGAFDLDERFFSGGKKTPVRCVGVITRADLLQSAALAVTDGGGWTNVISAAQTLNAADPVDPGGVYETGPFSLFKIQFTTTLGSPMTTVHQEHDFASSFDPEGVEEPVEPALARSVRARRPPSEPALARPFRARQR